jgi:hypothetical protein
VILPASTLRSDSGQVKKIVVAFFFCSCEETGHGRMEVDTGGLIMITEAGAEVEADATESGASEPPQAELAAE